jgi:hypothetical protein
MSTSPMGANKPIEDIEAHLLASTKSALDELVWWAPRDNGSEIRWSAVRRVLKELSARRRGGADMA